ncbi:lipid-binding SYLF domain-containing protein [Porticoccus sp. GXU_MW_L64]
MKTALTAVLITLALFVAGCSSIKGNTVQERRGYVENMRSDALRDLYKEHPKARQQIADAAGYAVFSNINTNLIFVTTTGGYGVVTRKGGGKTYMRMAGGGLGIGAGLRDMRLVLIFRKAHDLENFADNGWDVSGQAGATAQSDDQGGSVNVVKSVDFDIVSYELTKAGIALEATVDGMKFWQDKELNSRD